MLLTAMPPFFHCRSGLNTLFMAFGVEASRYSIASLMTSGQATQNGFLLSCSKWSMVDFPHAGSTLPFQDKGQIPPVFSLHFKNGLVIHYLMKSSLRATRLANRFGRDIGLRLPQNQQPSRSRAANPVVDVE
jgi:hypothetical protein